MTWTRVSLPLLAAALALAPLPAAADRDSPGRQDKQVWRAPELVVPQPRPAATAAPVGGSLSGATPEPLIVPPAPAPPKAEEIHRKKIIRELMHAEVGVPTPKLDSDGAIPLSLDEAMRLALHHSMDLQFSKLDVGSAEASVLGARGEFDPILNGFYEHAHDVQPSGSDLDADVSETDADIYSIGVFQKLVYGASYDVSLGSSRRETNNPFSSLNPSFGADATFTYTQPLLRGLGRDANRRFIAQALNSTRISELSLEMQARDVVRDVVRAYWDLAFTRGDLRVRRASLDLAAELLRKNRIMVEVGTLAPLEVTQAEASVAEREFRIINAEAAVGAAEDNLRRLLGAEEGSRWWDVPIVPTEQATFRDVEANLDESLSIALDQRQEVAVALLSVENARLGVAAARDSLRPELDLQVSLGTAGLGGDAFIDADPTIDSDGDTIPFNDEDLFTQGDVGDAFDQISDTEFNSWSASLTYTQPLRNRAARGEYLSQRLDLERARLDVAQLEQSITLEVRKAIRDLEAARESFVSAGVAKNLQQRTLDAEIKKFENGLSTNFEVLQFQTDLQEAASAELGALRNYLQAIVELQRARGTLLAEHGLQSPVPRS